MSENSRAVARSLGVLEQLSVAARPLTNEQLARALGIPASSCFRLLRKLLELGYVEFDAAGYCYSIGARLGDLAERLTDVACRSLPIRQLLTNLRNSTGFHVSIWVPSGVHVRIASLLAGTRRGPTSNLPGETASPFSTPGIAIAFNYTDAEVRHLALQCRKHGETLGRDFSTVKDILRALRSHRVAGYVTGYNMRSDGWAMLAWPIPVTLKPMRFGAVSLGAPVTLLRRQELELVRLTGAERERYLRALGATQVR